MENKCAMGQKGLMRRMGLKKHAIMKTKTLNAAVLNS
jgi:hypothetical protein